ncbi:hypothetical protein [Pseudoalteromonas sp. BDTF-M6]|uniref:hypothetical protein n=1 Tax=Pseudoalteromonas sp. BDTF-M6 TaxID=2796132 RepID=UPI001BAF6C41|nr:hypothetical protein [Pseudoalteromonas sp. BDTF-M6]MBS3796690.1 hypothetical protein [Pseudoalteromonas sp. BDTF-M6]
MNNNELNKSILHSETPPSCGIYDLFCHTVNRCMRQSPYSRPGIADRMNSALDTGLKEVDETKLNKWFAPSQPNNMPTHYLPALCWALESVEPAEVLLGPIQFKPVDQRAQLLQQHAELELEKEQLTQRQHQILQTLSPSKLSPIDLA